MAAFSTADLFVVVVGDVMCSDETVYTDKAEAGAVAKRVSDEPSPFLAGLKVAVRVMPLGEAIREKVEYEKDECKRGAFFDSLRRED